MSALTDLPFEYVQCRLLIHAWDEIPMDDLGPKKWRYSQRSTAIFLFRCVRCGTKRYDVYSRVTGDLIDRAYRAPEGYALPKGRGRKVLVRKEYIRRGVKPTRLRNVS